MIYKLDHKIVETHHKENRPFSTKYKERFVVEVKYMTTWTGGWSWHSVATVCLHLFTAGTFKSQPTEAEA